MGSFVSLCSGTILLLTSPANRSTPTLVQWGIASLLTAAGIVSLMLALIYGQPPVLAFANAVLAFAHALFWRGAGALDAKRVPLTLMVLGPAIVILLAILPETRPIAGSASLGISAAYVFGAMLSLWFGRAESLPARWPLVAVFALHAAVLVSGAYTTRDGAGVHDQVPPLLSLFGAIHFESIIFAIGTTVFLLLLVKERSEAATRLVADIDALTGIANRAAFMERAARVVERCRRNKVSVSAIMFDLDHFKDVNDSFGHAIGDAVLQKFCEITAAALRPTDIFGRIGGEEFAAVLPRSGIEASFIRAERIRAAFAGECRMVGGCHVNATVSGGVAASLDEGIDLSLLLKRADDALYRAKAAGRDRVKRAGALVPNAGDAAVIRVA